MNKKFLVFVTTITLMFSSKAQDVGGFEAILLAGEDTEKLTQAYINPAMTGLIVGMNSGWYHTAKVHKKLGFDLTIGLNMSSVPSEEEIFRFADLGLANITSTSATGATVAGSNDLKAPVIFNGTIQGQNVTTSFNLPGGIKEDIPLSALPTPAAQFNLGLPGKLEAMVRFVPEVGSDDVTGNLLGVGLKKEITSWFGPMKRTPLHVSLLAAYTSMSVDYDIQSGSTIGGSGQKAELELSAYTIEAIASLNFPIISVFGGIGYSSGSSDLRMLGTYNLEYDTGLPAPFDTITESVSDPISLNFEESGIKTTIGTRISLGFFKIFGSYTLQRYNTLSAGIAIGFR